MKTRFYLLTTALACGLPVSPASAKLSLLEQFLRKAVDASAPKSIGKRAVTVPLTTQDASRPNADPMRLDIAGVRLGMTPDQARAASQAAGYTIGHSPVSQSFEQKVLTKLRERKPSVAYIPSSQEKTPREISAKGPSGEHLWLRFAPTPAGPRLMFASLSIDERRVTKDEFGEQVMAKYGVPTASHLDSMADFWCAKSILKCGVDWVGGDYPYLKHSYGASGPSLTLTDESRSSKAVEDAVMAEVDRRAPLVRASF